MSEASEREAKYQQGEPPRPDSLASDVIISPHTWLANRLPPGQSRTRVWPVLDAFGPPAIDPVKWSLQVCGLVSSPGSLSLEGLSQLQQVKVFSDFHCVTRWSRLGNLWGGVSTSTIASHFGLQTETRFVILHAADEGWTTNLPLSMFLAEDSLLALRHDGESISAEHGGPVRALFPQLYAWKSAKWLTRIEFVADDRPGYWEQGGYHLVGDPWREQRFRWD